MNSSITSIKEESLDWNLALNPQSGSFNIILNMDTIKFSVSRNLSANYFLFFLAKYFFTIGAEITNYFS